jgi:hypothetical protein
MAITYSDKIRLALESIEESVDRKSKKTIKEDNAIAAAGRFNPATQTTAPAQGRPLSDTTISAMKSLIQTLVTAVKTQQLDEEGIKNGVKEVSAQLKAEKQRKGIHDKYVKELEGVEKAIAKQSKSASTGTAKVQKPAPAAEKKEGEPKKEMAKPAEKRDPKAAEKNQASKEEFEKGKKNATDPKLVKK